MDIHIYTANYIYMYTIVHRVHSYKTTIAYTQIELETTTTTKKLTKKKSSQHLITRLYVFVQEKNVFF